jgi:hypothetical protein
LTLDPFPLVLILLARFQNKYQGELIDDLQEENCLLREQHGGKQLRFNDDERRRLAIKAKKLGRRGLHS